MEQSLKAKLNKILFILIYESSLELKIKEMQYTLEQADSEVKNLENRIADFKKRRYNYDSMHSFANILMLISIYGFIGTGCIAIGASLGAMGMAHAATVLAVVSSVTLVISLSMKYYSKCEKTSVEKELTKAHGEASRDRARARAKCEPCIAGIRKQIENGRRASEEFFAFLPIQYRNAEAVTFMLKAVEESGTDNMDEVIKLYEEDSCIKKSFGLGATEEESMENMQNLAARMDEKYVMSEETILWLFDMYK